MQAKRSGPGGLVWRIVLVLLVAGALGWWILGQRRAPRAPIEPAEQSTTDPPPDPEPQWRPRTKHEPAPGCEPRADKTCVDGDVWWVDSCGEPHERDRDCGLGDCAVGACQPAPQDCGDLPAVGRCDGDLAEVCDAGRTSTVDCGEDGLRCVMLDDGPVCRAPTAEDCDWPPGSATCEADVMVSCRGGRLQKLDCSTLNASCVGKDGVARCVAEVSAARADEGCGPCGCDEELTGEEICDGRDNDGDGHIDEDGCDPVDIVAFVVTDKRGRTEYSPEELALELQRVNRAFARDDGYGLEFQLADTVYLAEPDLLEADEVEFDRLVDTMLYPQRESAFVPILFTDRVYIEGIPRPGASTVPNGMCGGKRRDPAWQPTIGLIAIGRRRWETTVAHEIGHFLGLCHTHGDHIDAVQHAVGIDGEPIACDESCVLEADGICDTPPDPGPVACTVGDECTVACTTGEVPDGRNLMGYYPACRSVFSRQQALLMRQMLALRRSWQPCALGSGCSCEPTLHDCPRGMTCRRLANSADGEELGYRCGVDGASVPGGTCKDPRDCSGGATCMTAPTGESLCIRPCDESTPHCDCRELPGNPWPICFADTARAQTADGG
ncbi:MAG: M43 family zinc metalloprotease [Myxococcota bacterium]